MLTVVTGPPCSGKSTYVRTHRGPDDVVIDFDLIAQALGSGSPHDHNAAVRHVTMMARRAAIDAAITMHRAGHTAWVVDCNIPDARMRAYRTAGAHFVVLGADKGELHRRAAAERPGLWHRLIDEWRPPAGLSNTAPNTVASRDW